MRINRRLRQLRKSAKQNINNAYDRIEHIKQELNFQGFGDNEPEILVDTSYSEYDISIMWDDVILDIDDVICASEEQGKITPEILTNLICNEIL